MKKALAMTLIVMLLLTGCSAAADPQSLSQSIAGGFQCVAEITFGDTQYRARLNCTGESGCMLELLEPAHLNGMTLNWENGTLTVQYLGFSLGIATQNLPNAAWSRMLVEVFQRAMQAEGLKADTNDDQFTLSGATDAGEFSLSFDRKTGALTALSLPSAGLEASFNEFSAGQPAS